MEAPVSVSIRPVVWYHYKKKRNVCYKVLRLSQKVNDYLFFCDLFFR